ncbi:MAG: acetyl-CoA acetyltransferase [Rhodospirillaceae bacterium]|nr:acetyl-CoA acetyltransferase [Rhodospirillaceae bacterium]MDD9917235.1 acetyl-CoA acetyltransferase [Rhodospirillaceae bacterium]MDD9929513.1 acetyl-CoA acetyltransferase [Rhodospirillaceae bacterium]
MAMDDRTPIIVGVAQVEQREDDPAASREPLDLMVEAVEKAGADCGNPQILQQADSVRVIRGIWGYGNPARQVAERIGASGAETGLTSLGGNYVQAMTNRSFLDIQSGEREIVIVTGGECGRTQARARKAGLELAWNPLTREPGASPTTVDDGDAPEMFLGSSKVTRHEAEMKRGIQLPIQFYPMFETALRHANGESVDGHLKRVSELWAGFNKVAVDNPNAWIRKPISAEDIRTPSPANRPISYPYTKLMNSNNSVDQGAALILTSVGKARSLGIPEDRWVYPHAGTEAWDHLYVSERDNLHTSPAIRLASRKLFELTGFGVDDIDTVDLYSCFPAAVQVSANEIGLTQDRALTVTGGLTFAGGPLNNYVMHSVARTVDLMRDKPGSIGLVTANGGLLTKHALCIYSTTPPEKPFAWANLQAEVDAMPRRDVAVDHDGSATVESYVVMYDAAGSPEKAHAACLLDDGRRTWANVTDLDTVGAMMREEFCGRSGTIDGDGGLTVN